MKNNLTSFICFFLLITGCGFKLVNNSVEYTFPGTPYTANTLTWIWSDGPGAPATNKELKLPKRGKLPLQGAMFIGEKGRLLLPHFMERPRLIIDNQYNLGQNDF